MSKRAAVDCDEEDRSATFMTKNAVDEEKCAGPILVDGGSAALMALLDANFISYDRRMEKAALASLLAETVEARSRIPQLNEDVQGYIVSFLSGFDSLQAVSQLARGFRVKAKPRLDLILKRTDDDVLEAAKAWCEDAEVAREVYGHISIWKTSEVTSMRYLFQADGWGGYEAARQFNEDISRWDVGNVTNMAAMFWGASAFNGDLSSWNVANVRSMASMFRGAASFNCDISSWEVTNVTTVEFMFNQASAFNGDLSSWNVASATNMNGMCWGTSSWNSETIKNSNLRGVCYCGLIFL
ncbi:hypothetical protein TrST_g8945 [Triparma strigata]|uniref:BspA family leucine-rich repeat surface protein n=1 Tax=Triparma strigata TaxID=1606541 RepID=A0A9W7F2R8_9STRA|nr:hypothetical protein TrST_g8945 [Triparma strigata]